LKKITSQASNAGFALVSAKDTKITYNTFVQNQCNIYLEKSSSLEIKYNNIMYSVIGCELFAKSGGKSVNAKNNWWRNYFGPIFKVSGVPISKCIPWSFSLIDLP